MTPVHYKTRILPDGHLSVPEEFHARAGDEVEVTLAPVAPNDANVGPVDLRDRGIEEIQAADLRARLRPFAEDWERPEMGVYDAL